MSGHPPLPALPLDLPLLPLRDVVVFPHMVIPLFVGRPKSIKALESAMESERRIMLVAQKAAAKDEPSAEDMFSVGCVATILQMLKLPDGTVKVLVEGQQRARVNRITEGEHYFSSNVTPVEPQAAVAGERGSELEALRRDVPAARFVSGPGEVIDPEVGPVQQRSREFAHVRAVSADRGDEGVHDR